MSENAIEAKSIFLGNKTTIVTKPSATTPMNTNTGHSEAKSEASKSLFTKTKNKKNDTKNTKHNFIFVTKQKRFKTHSQLTCNSVQKKNKKNKKKQKKT